ncbi:DUF1292 domain-containing protein [Fructilactobacillus sanfranciscensis]|uniref:UPF0473 protein DID87_00155 n=1 Tax=Fructilactobacillus sanfranciscensis TaxID=1625 RepID=A0A5C4TKR4_FRUSA|nr:DUF1292 domain-containing protein [Fructilactobacillus sanfranciscensis]KRM81133.1 hypothetical protein FD36_GL000030 [Fructilactobacillus sanfranciscensis DSM 20451]MCG7193977.1 DUF1292 domain-containing protein [Fructilactobacillus sanfranciscensis]MCG7195239.1 DUF1292 domain-containing protein [Fructilactobacillus sanfranciscensis]MDN4461706.1 DUF1292 domain-containing protein [Fructilactobacillus sanfranciscensis]MVF15570.1 DUF1292 domain-containing protein [Fructilactobacillus sanfranc
MNNEPEQITLIDENGDEILYNELFTFESKDYDRSYILMYPASEEGNEDINIEAYALPKGTDPTSPEDGDLEPIEDDAEWEMVQETLNTFLAPEDDN